MRCSLLGCMIASALFATAAYAFEQETAPAPKAGPNAKLSGEDLPKGKGDDGTVVAIPGLGKLGVIPKLDFGLDLLYGDDANKPAIDEGLKSNDQNSDDLRIRGSIKHRF